MTDLLRASAGGVSSETLAAAGSVGNSALLESPRPIKGFDACAQALVGATPEIMKVFGFAGWSGSGKTTLIERLIPRFVAQGLRVSLIKHAHHAFDIDRPGKDSYRHREAGCQEVVVCSAKRWVLMHEARGAPEPTLEELIARMSPCELLLIEGYKFHPIPKLEVYRHANGKPPLHPEDPHIVAIAADGPLATPLPVIDLNDHDAIADFVLAHVGLKSTLTA